MALFRRIQEYIALDANYIIVNISGNIFLYPPQVHPIFHNYIIARSYFSLDYINWSMSFEFCRSEQLALYYYITILNNIFIMNSIKRKVINISNQNCQCIMGKCVVKPWVVMT